MRTVENDFRRVLAAESISNFSSMPSRLALPWLATLSLGATPLEMSLLLVADVAAGAAGSLAARPAHRPLVEAEGDDRRRPCPRRHPRGARRPRLRRLAGDVGAGRSGGADRLGQRRVRAGPVGLDRAKRCAGAAAVPLAKGATLAGAALLVVHQLVGDGGATIFKVHDRTLRQTAVAPELLARADGGLRSLGQLATLVGALGGGWLATEFSARFALSLVVAVFAVAAGVAHHRLRAQR